MSNSGRRNMAMNNPNHCMWQGQGRNFYNRMANQNHPMFFPGQPRPPFPYNFNMAPPYPGLNWQGPGPARPRGRSGRGYRGARRSNNQDREDALKDVCCKCGERLQNSDELGVHLCDGGNEVLIPPVEEVESGDEQVGGGEAAGADEPEKDLDDRLEKLLTNLKDFVRSKYKTVTDALEGYVSEKIEEITTLHRENAEEKEVLEKLKKELEDKSAVLLKEEKELRDKQHRLGRDREVFQKEMVREKEEVCRKWQALRDEITRMEEVHKTQQGRIKLDVGGHVFTTSLLTLTREQDSMLAAMFSGRHEINKEDDGCVFIDRDGTHFRYVLNYLRDGGVGMECLPRDRQLLRELRKEATYYQLHGLLHQIERCL